MGRIELEEVFFCSILYSLGDPLAIQHSHLVAGNLDEAAA